MHFIESLAEAIVVECLKRFSSSRKDAGGRDPDAEACAGDTYQGSCSAPLCLGGEGKDAHAQGESASRVNLPPYIHSILQIVPDSCLFVDQPL